LIKFGITNTNAQLGHNPQNLNIQHFCHYPLPKITGFDCGFSFVGVILEEVFTGYGFGFLEGLIFFFSDFGVGGKENYLMAG
jgi:hypothetical protein